MTERGRALLVRSGWLVAAAPGIAQLALLLYAVAMRYSYPYDLEWMEGGLLVHAQRIASGDGIYVPPSMDFIPYLYTPLYPGVVATAGAIVDISYQLGRAISILSLLGIFVVGAASLVGDGDRRLRAPAWTGVALAIGLIAATYPFVEGWYDLVRADTLFLFLVIGGLVATYRFSRGGTGARGHIKIAVAGAILALAFFCKQTGILYVAAGGAVVLVRNWRRVPAYVLAAGAIGLGGVKLLESASGGWFWTYAFKVHQAHDFSMDRFWRSFSGILFHFPAMTALVGGALFLVLIAAVQQRRLPAAAGPLLLWSWVYAVSVLVGALGWATQWAHFNAFMPALFTGALAAGAAVPAVIGAVRVLCAVPDPPAPMRWPAAAARVLVLLWFLGMGLVLCTLFWNEPWAVAGGINVPVALVAAVVSPVPYYVVRSVRGNPAFLAVLAPAAGFAAAVALGVQLLLAWWQPATFIPTASDREAGDALVERIREVEGEVWVPSHPWYAHLAGKRPWVHRMGMKDVTYGGKWRVAGIDDMLRNHRFAALFLDNRDVQTEFPMVKRYYRRDDKIPRDERPHLYTGAEVVPDSIWIPAVKLPPPAGAKVAFDFEDGTLEGWKIEGEAWGKTPVTDSLPDQGAVRRWGGRWFADSMHQGDAAIGVLESPPFTIDGVRLTFRMSGGADNLSLRAELRVDGKAMRTASNEERTEAMTVQSWEVADLVGKTATIAFIDDAKGSWGHLCVDEILLWD